MEEIIKIKLMKSARLIDLDDIPDNSRWRLSLHLLGKDRVALLLLLLMGNPHQLLLSFNQLKEYGLGNNREATINAEVLSSPVVVQL